MIKPLELLKKIFQRPQMLPASDIVSLTDKEKELLAKIGVTVSQLRKKLEEELAVNYSRYELYVEEARAIEHWFVGSAAKLYAEVATPYNRTNSATVWVVSDEPSYQREITELFESIGIEEKIFDWAYQLVAFGDLFVEVNAAPSIGIISVNDNEHPINISRIDIDGLLAGFFKTPNGFIQQTSGSEETEILPPWKYVHFRLLGARKFRKLAGDPVANEFRSLHLLGGAVQRQLSSAYGTSIIADAIAPYKRLRLAEDSLLLARLTRGILRYIYKVKVDSNNAEAVAELMDQYVALLKRARAIDTNTTSSYFDSKSNPFSSVEDLIVPVWGDANDIVIDKIGGEADIRWITDIIELRNQLATALKCPLALLGSYIQEASGQLGNEAIEQLDIGFSRNVWRVQRALISGLTRLAQIHLAHQGKNPSTEFFKIQMGSTSSIEDQKFVAALDGSIEVVSKLFDLLDKFEDVDKDKVFDFLNQKILKIEGFTLEDFKTLAESKEKILRRLENKQISPLDTDVRSYLPVNDNVSWVLHKDLWENRFGGKKIIVEFNGKK